MFLVENCKYNIHQTIKKKDFNTISTFSINLGKVLKYIFVEIILGAPKTVFCLTVVFAKITLSSRTISRTTIFVKFAVLGRQKIPHPVWNQWGGGIYARTSMTRPGHAHGQRPWFGSRLLPWRPQLENYYTPPAHGAPVKQRRGGVMHIGIVLRV